MRRRREAARSNVQEAATICSAARSRSSRTPRSTSSGATAPAGGLGEGGGGELGQEAEARPVILSFESPDLANERGALQLAARKRQLLGKADAAAAFLRGAESETERQIYV